MCTPSGASANFAMKSAYAFQNFLSMGYSTNCPLNYAVILGTGPLWTPFFSSKDETSLSPRYTLF